jgi:hypothetical protein
VSDKIPYRIFERLAVAEATAAPVPHRLLAGYDAMTMLLGILSAQILSLTLISMKGIHL